MVVSEQHGYIFLAYRFDGMLRIDKNGTRLTKSDYHATTVAIDNTEERLYWSDKDTDMIESCDFQLTNYRVIIDRSYSYFFSNFHFRIKPDTISIEGENIYWTDRQLYGIFLADKWTGNNIEYITGGIKNSRSIVTKRDMPTAGK